MKKLFIFTIAITLLLVAGTVQADEVKWFEMENMNWEQHIIANRAIPFTTVSIKFMDAFEKSCGEKIDFHNNHTASNSLDLVDLPHVEVMTANCEIIIITTDMTEVDTEPHTWSDNSSILMKKVMAGVEGDENQENY